MIRYPHERLSTLLCALFSLFGSPTLAKESSPPPPGHHSVFVFMQRTSGHVKYSTSEVFQNVVEDVFAHLNSMNVSIAADSFGGRKSSEDVVPLETVQRIARDSGADFLLHFVVDRPLAKWLRIVANCYDSSGNQLWSEEAASGGGISGSHGLRVTLARLHQRLDQHLGKPGLPLKSADELPSKSSRVTSARDSDLPQRRSQP